MKVKSLSLVQLLATPWTAAHQAPPSMRFSRQECWSGVPLPSPLDLLQAVYLANNPKIAGVGQGWRMGRDSLYIPEKSFVFTREES